MNINSDFSSLKSVDVSSYSSIGEQDELTLMAQKDTTSEIGIWAGDFPGF